MLWAVVSSARCTARKLESPVPSRSAITQLLRRYRPGVSGLEPIHISGRRSGKGLPVVQAPYLLEGRHQLVGVRGVRGVAAALQGIREGAHVAAGAEGLGVARVVANHVDIIGEVFRDGSVGAEPGALGAGYACDIFRRVR